MSLVDWAKNGWLRTHQPSKEEIQNLLEIVERDLKDASVKRNETEYDFAGTVSEEEAHELIDFCKELKTEAITWLKKNHKKLLK